MFAAESCVSRSIAALTLHMQRSIGQAAQALRARTAEGRRYLEPKRSTLRPDPTPLSGGCGWVHPSWPPRRQARDRPQRHHVSGVWKAARVRSQGSTHSPPACAGILLSALAECLRSLKFMESDVYTRRRRQASVSPKADTVEELQSRRKRLHVGMAKLAHDDLHRQLVQVQADAQVRNGLPCLFRERVVGRDIG